MNDTSYAFKISFSTQSPGMNEIVYDKTKKKTLVDRNDDYQEFFSPCEKIADLESIEVPMPKNILDDIKQLFISVSMLQNNGERVSIKKPKMSLDDK